MARLTAGRLDLYRDFPGPAFGCHVGEEFRGFAFGFGGQAMGLAGQGVPGQGLANGLHQRLGQARMGGHEKIGLRKRVGWRRPIAPR